jgi:hypothetical protein
MLLLGGTCKVWQKLCGRFTVFLDCYTVTLGLLHGLGTVVLALFHGGIGTVTVTFVVGVSSIVGVSMVNGHHHHQYRGRIE